MKNIGYTQKKYRCEVKRYCQTLDLKDNPELISEYKLNHSREKIWPEIIEGIIKTAIKEYNALTKAKLTFSNGNIYLGDKIVYDRRNSIEF